jgi:hypothetical protein
MSERSKTKVIHEKELQFTIRFLSSTRFARVGALLSWRLPNCARFPGDANAAGLVDRPLA